MFGAKELVCICAPPVGGPEYIEYDL